MARWHKATKQFLPVQDPLILAQDAADAEARRTAAEQAPDNKTPQKN